MPFLKQTDYKTIMQAKKDGNPQAIAIIQTYLKGGTQFDLDRMVHAFYNPDPVEDAKEQEAAPENAEAQQAVEKANEDVMPEAPVVDTPADLPVDETPIPEVTPVETSVAPDSMAEFMSIDDDLNGLIDEDEISEMSFEDFLADKKKNANRMAMDANHFKMYDPEARAAYLASKCDEYDKSFGTKRKDIERSFRDMDSAIAKYSQSLSDTVPDDGIELNSDITGKAYSDIVDASGKTHAFGRSWDEEDTAEMIAVLNSLVASHGKANVLAALNIIRGDNEAFRDRRNGQIESAVKHYSKQLEDLLK